MLKLQDLKLAKSNMQKTTQKVPTHVAVICDGNRRWAKGKGLAAVKGHQHAAAAVFEPLVDTALALGIKVLTFWVFSTENWQRSPLEVRSLMELLRTQLRQYQTRLHDRNVKIETIGDLRPFPIDIQQLLVEAKERTQSNTAMTVVFALNYGGRDELTRAARRVAELVQRGELAVEDIDQTTLAQHLDTAGLPDPELIIRTGGEQRLSGFLPWQTTYAEFAFTNTFFPDLTPEIFTHLIEEFAGRQRRFGR